MNYIINYFASGNFCPFLSMRINFDLGFSFIVFQFWELVRDKKSRGAIASGKYMEFHYYFTFRATNFFKRYDWPWIREFPKIAKLFFLPVSRQPIGTPEKLSSTNEGDISFVPRGFARLARTSLHSRRACAEETGRPSQYCASLRPARRCSWTERGGRPVRCVLFSKVPIGPRDSPEISSPSRSPPARAPRRDAPVWFLKRRGQLLAACQYFASPPGRASASTPIVRVAPRWPSARPAW